MQITFRLSGAPLEKAVKTLEFNHMMNVLNVKAIVKDEYKLNPILELQLLWRGKVLPEHVRINDIPYKKDEVMIIFATQSGGDIGYKVVQKFEDKLLSFNFVIRDINDYNFHKERHHIVDYKVGEEVFPDPDAGPLAVFTDLEDAKKLFGGSNEYPIYKCEFIPSTEIIMFYMKKYIGYDYCFLESARHICGNSVVFANSVKLLEEIER